MKLFLFTDSFPYGRGEQYLANEMNFLSDFFEEIVIFPIKVINHGKDQRKIARNVTIVDLQKYADFSKWNFVRTLPFLFFRAWEEKKHPSSNQSFWQNLKTIFNANQYNKALQYYITKNDQYDDVIFYSYWFYHWALVLSLFRKDNPHSRAISRVHMGDLYDEIKKTPFRFFKMKYLSEIYPISEHGKHYLLRKYPKYDFKIKKSYLGVYDNGGNPLEEVETKTIVTCSAIRPSKRLSFIAECLTLCKISIRWIHFGDGPEKSKLVEQIKNLPKHISVELKGHRPNNEVLNYYGNAHIDLFINLSLEEGLPVSLMEAISFGIPVMGTKLYGIPEIVEKETGILIDKNALPKEIANKIDDVLSHQSIDRMGIKTYWKSKFNAAKNYPDFIKEIAS